MPDTLYTIAKLDPRNRNLFIVLLPDDVRLQIWSCCGVRLGSVVAPTPLLQKEVKAKQVHI